MATLFQTDAARGFVQSPRGLSAGVVMCARMKFIFSTAFAFATDKLELGVLPPFCRIVDATLLGELGSVNLVSIGLMSGEVGVNDVSRTVGSELFSGVSGNGVVTRMSALTGFKQSAYDHPVALGATLSADVLASAAKMVELLLYYAPQT